MTKNGRGPTGRQARGAPVFQAVAGLAQTRLTVLSGITENVDWLFVEQPPEDKVSWAKAMPPGAAGILASVGED